jgi:hypothetical protein
LKCISGIDKIIRGKVEKHVTFDVEENQVKEKEPEDQTKKIRGIMEILKPGQTVLQAVKYLVSNKEGKR